ncbi:hypothetical protein [Mucilaginibacter gotjawali]|uniref:Uncharacterized protein n=1 Tax=Mucilaginibacter gotjawali TaxID=1550579 RepID=A0A839SGM7_9SPHI|nr:hypothetical protein [Mucilaginibacter gotjawali]MBB3056678.1 hypothetical protein [Mucilaginibacter gotjawali]
MKKTTFIIALLSVMYVSVLAIPQVHPVKPKRDTVHNIKNQPKPKIVKGRKARMRLQEKQIKNHEKQFKKIDSAQKKLNGELKRKDT